MIADRERVGQALSALAMYGNRDRVFVELGCGTGLFSIEATKHYGAVIAVEKDPNILEVARAAAARADVSDKVRFIQADGLDVSWRDIGVRADVVFSEMLSIWLIEEPQILMANHARNKILNQGGVVIPRRVSNLLECANYNFSPHGIELKAPLAEFVTGLPPRLNTVSHVGDVFDLQSHNDLRTSGVVEFAALTSDVVNCVRLSSIVEFSEGCNFYSTDTLMPVTIVPTRNEAAVRRGDNFSIAYEFEHGRPLGESRFEIIDASG
jgi:predicted RNA methylase